MKAKVYSLQGKALQSIDLPPVFQAPLRSDLIRRAVLASQSARYQPQGVDWMAGKRTSAFSWGPGRGVSRVPRVKGSRHPASGRGGFVPQAVGGRRAFPPVVEKRIQRKINRKERRKAIASALAASASQKEVERRGHRIEGVPQIPLIVEDSLEELKVCRESREVLQKLGAWEDIERAGDRKIRAGKGKRRGRKYKNRKSLLIVVSEDRGIGRGTRNFPGVDVVTAENLSAEDLAPGTQAGRFTLFTKAAVEVLGRTFGDGTF
jgi:large subunit ribosomal protein L4e